MEDIVNGYLDKVIDWIPGMENMRLKDFPSFIRTTDSEDIMLAIAKHELERISMASAIILNTFDDFEHQVLQAMSSIILPSIYTIGPLTLLAARTAGSSLADIRLNLWKEDPGCLEWLDGKEPRSVVYVNFGSLTVMTNEQLIEFAWGLANSEHKFLWIIRPDLVRGDTAVVPQEFMMETQERGLLASWCSQEQVLKHPSIGGFLTHCGWNSILESVCGGVPVICWPFFAEQLTNCRYLCTDQWGMGMEIDNNVKREEVEKLIKELMNGEKGMEMRNRALEWKELAVRATEPGGSSSVNFDRLVTEVLHPNNYNN
ncbi:7-deoxyloganetin glucosyltransferase-like [Dioscorea cayenensis subsp. rotundata]|uniref:7-deoxyloganetin glucosyltransferase-like n=1 Tax=Dioscorea cayennensis subsp. rotundata TaxID=55577 RepID=A0AB40BA73_DIOCR|nr:7-deoxyloganetin glucosyltransferase-like [Dioscorea cayenensis subsp. rotundata]